jgi:hypothetical protein
MLHKILKQLVFWILFYDFQNMTCYSESKCKILYLAFAPCLEWKHSWSINWFLVYNPKHNRTKFSVFFTPSQHFTQRCQNKIYMHKHTQKTKKSWTEYHTTCKIIFRILAVSKFCLTYIKIGSNFLFILIFRISC